MKTGIIVTILSFLCVGQLMAQDETPYSSKQPTIAPNIPNPPGVIDTKGPNRGSRAGGGPPGLPEAVRTTPPPPPVILPSAPQVVTGTGRNYGNVTLRVDPLLIRVIEDQLFQQDIVIDNPRGVTIDEVEVVLKYSTKYLDMIDMDPNIPGVNIKPLINSQKNPGLQVVLNSVDTQKGLIYFIVKSLSSNSYLGGKLATVTFQAKKSCFYTPITFSFASDLKSPGTKAIRNGRDILGWDYDLTDGIITGGISISAKPIDAKVD